MPGLGGDASQAAEEEKLERKGVEELTGIGCGSGVGIPGSGMTRGPS